MATAAKSATDVTGVILALSPHDVLVGDRLGAFWPDKAAALGKLMAQDGQIAPIIVRASGPRAAQPWTLVAGHHRLEGAKLEGLAIIDAIETSGGPDDLSNIEAMENIRPSRSPIERACFVRAIADAAEARLKNQHGDLSPEQIAIRARWDGMKAKAAGVERDETLNDAEADHTRLNLSRVYSWRDEVAEGLGFSLASLKRDLALHRALVAPFPTLYRALATHPQVGENASALREIAAIRDVGNRRALIEALIATPDLTLLQAMEGLGLSKPGAIAAQGPSKFQNGVLSNLDRLSSEQQRSIATSFADKIKPSALEEYHTAIIARIKKEGGGA